MKENQNYSNETVHKPVLLQEIIENLNLSKNSIVFDGTLGGAGYSEEIIKKISPDGILIATDLDQNALKRSEERLKKFKIKKWTRKQRIQCKTKDLFL